MRHGKSYRKLGRTSSHRAALLRNQLASVLEHERIITTLPKAKELRPIVEKTVTLGREDTVHNRRLAASSIQRDDLVKKLFDTIGPRFADRPGGYTRIIKLGARRGDDAERAILEFVDYELKTEAVKPAPKAKAAPKKKAKDEGEGAEAEGEEAEEKPAKKPAKKKAAPKREAAPKKSASKKAAPKKGGSKGSKRGS
jgi:large subunit ribosomal protein L17